MFHRSIVALAGLCLYLGMLAKAVPLLEATPIDARGGLEFNTSFPSYYCVGQRYVVGWTGGSGTIAEFQTTTYTNWKDPQASPGSSSNLPGLNFNPSSRPSTALGKASTTNGFSIQTLTKPTSSCEFISTRFDCDLRLTDGSFT